MIKNDKQYSITKNKRAEFEKSLKLLKSSKNNVLLDTIMSNSINSQIETFDKEILEYEKLKYQKPYIIASTIENLPESLIKARIVRGFSQNDLAMKTGVKEQQIQRYEATGYETASFDKILSIAKSMDVIFEDTRLIMRQDQIKVEGYDPCFIRQATSKLQLRKSLLTV